MAKNITIRIPDEAAHWARRKAAEENTSISKLVSHMLERQMRLSDEYWQAFERWKTLVPEAGLPVSERGSRAEIHERHQ